ncbi:MAG: type III pantothenate kinase [Candidatus Margulisiibacteriota bacterium]
MHLVIDVGNSTVKFGIFDAGKIKKEWSFRTERLFHWNPDRSIVSLPATISSVVPEADAFLKKLFRGSIFVTAKNIKGIKIKFKKKSEIGADRLVDALAVKELYGHPAIVIDFGTATTFDLISKKGEYLGGAIAPGIGLSKEVLHTATAKLPLIEIKPPKNIIGNSTVEAMRSGLVYGYASLVEGMISRFKNKIGRRAKVVATGGYAKLIAKYARGIDIIDIDLTLKGLNIIYREPAAKRRGS